MARKGRGSAADLRQRQLAIQDFVGAEGSRTIDEIAEHAGVSTMTIYRDVAELESLGMLRLSKGVVSASASNRHEASSRFRATQLLAEKAKLAAAALDLVEPGAAIILDDSTTGVPFAEELADKAPLTVVTNYLPVATAVSQFRDVRLIMTGGEYVVWAEAFFGPLAASTIRHMHADAVFMSASAITAGVAYHPTSEPAELKREMLASAALKVLYADHTKFTRTALHEVAPLSAFDVLIVDDLVPDDVLAPIADSGVRIIRAG